MKFGRSDFKMKWVGLFILLLLFCSVNPPSAFSIEELTPGVPVTGDLVGTTDAKYYRVNAASGSDLFITADGGSPYDKIYLYVKHGAVPTTSDYDAASVEVSPSQAIAITGAQEGYYYIMVYGSYIYSYGYTGKFTITTTFESGGPSYSLSGQVTFNGSGLDSVSVLLSGSGAGSTTTDSNGNYTFTGIGNGTYTVTPSKSGYTFSPSSSQVIISGANQTGVDFVGYAAGSCYTWDDVMNAFMNYVAGTGTWDGVMEAYQNYVLDPC